MVEGIWNTLALPPHAKCLGYCRFWLAKHSNRVVIGGTATTVVMGNVAAGTCTIRVGSEGGMLLNRAPIIVAEQFSTLESLYPGRIDNQTLVLACHANGPRVTLVDIGVGSTDSQNRMCGRQRLSGFARS